MPLKSPEETQFERREKSAAGEPKEWPAIQPKALGNVTGTLITRWSDGKLYYYFRLSPYVPKDGFMLYFLDTDGFAVTEIKIKMNEMSRLLDAAAKPQALLINASITMDFTDYKRIAEWQFGWSLD